MRTWGRSSLSFVCGNCVRIVPPGEPVLRIFIQGLKEAKKRCGDCAGEPVPADLPELAARPNGLLLTRVDEDGIERPVRSDRAPSSLKQQVVDFTQRYLGEK